MRLRTTWVVMASTMLQSCPFENEIAVAIDERVPAGRHDRRGVELLDDGGAGESDADATACHDHKLSCRAPLPASNDTRRVPLIEAGGGDDAAPAGKACGWYFGTATRTRSR